MTTVSSPSLQSLLIELQFNGQRLSTGTAFVVQAQSGPQLITNRHIVTGRNQDTNVLLSTTGGVPSEMVIWHHLKGKLGHWRRHTELLYVGETPRWREHPTLGAKV